MIKKTRRLIIVVRGDDHYALDAALRIPPLDKTPFEVVVIGSRATCPKNSFVMFTGEKQHCGFRGTYVHAPLFSCEHEPLWAQNSVGVIILRPHEHIEDEEAFKHALGNAARIGWRRATRRVWGER